MVMSKKRFEYNPKTYEVQDNYENLRFDTTNSNDAHRHMKSSYFLSALQHAVYDSSQGKLSMAQSQSLVGIYATSENKDKFEASCKETLQSSDEQAKGFSKLFFDGDGEKAQLSNITDKVEKGSKLAENMSSIYTKRLVDGVKGT